MLAMIPSLWIPLALLCASFVCGSSDVRGSSVALAAPSIAIDEPLRFDRYHGCEEIEARFHALAAISPDWFRAASLGSSVEGRAIPILIVTEFATVADEAERPGFWIDGSIHGGELETTEVVLRVAEELRSEIAAGRAPTFLSQVSLYLVPVLNPDGRTRALASPPTPGRRNSAADGGVDLNREFPARWNAEEARFATDTQPESAAVMSFWRAHPKMQLAASFHTSVNGFLMPPLPMTRSERERYREIAAIYRDQLAIDSLPVPTHARGTTMDWFFAARRCIAFTIEFEGAYRPDAPQEERSTRRTRRFLSRELDPLTARHAAVLLQLARTLPE